MEKKQQQISTARKRSTTQQAHCRGAFDASKPQRQRSMSQNASQSHNMSRACTRSTHHDLQLSLSAERDPSYKLKNEDGWKAPSQT